MNMNKIAFVVNLFFGSSLVPAAHVSSIHQLEQQRLHGGMTSPHHNNNGSGGRAGGHVGSGSGSGSGSNPWSTDAGSPQQASAPQVNSNADLQWEPSVDEQLWRKQQKEAIAGLL